MPRANSTRTSHSYLPPGMEGEAPHKKELSFLSYSTVNLVHESGLLIIQHVPTWAPDVLSGGTPRRRRPMRWLLRPGATTCSRIEIKLQSRESQKDPLLDGHLNSMEVRVCPSACSCSQS